MKFWTHSSKKLVTKAALFSNTNTKKDKNFKSPRPILRKVEGKCTDSPTVQTYTNFYNYGSSRRVFFVFGYGTFVFWCSSIHPRFPLPLRFFAACNNLPCQVGACPKVASYFHSGHRTLSFSNQARVQRGKWWSKTKQVLNSVKRTQEM